ncbi:MAG TPA: glutamate--tRNA ligase family protein [Flavisolibacter sp.]|nr:glutamate--tRNA ligase family protein [Flavisolibacter sp.]
MNKPLQFQRTRIAPTPSGFLHLGNVLSFSLTAALARSTGARILLRIDDLDRDRVNKAYVQDIFDTLNFLEIPWDEGPRNMQEYESQYSQLHRMDHYLQALGQLKERNAVFACACSRAQVAQAVKDGSYPGTCLSSGLSLDARGIAWRLHTAGAGSLTVRTLNHQSIRAALPSSMQSFIVRKKDGYPAYQLASLVDDLYFKVDLIVRGEDLWPSTLGQLYLASVLEAGAFAGSHFHHHVLLKEGEGMKLSKSAGALSVQHLRKQGRKAGDIYRMISGMLGRTIPATSWKDLADIMDVPAGS